MTQIASSAPLEPVSFGYEPILRRAFRGRYVTMIAAGWLLGMAPTLIAHAAGMPVSVILGIAFASLSATLFAADWVAALAARATARPLDALLKVLPLEDQRRLVGDAADPGKAGGTRPGGRPAALAEALVRRISRDATLLSELARDRAEAEAANLAKSQFLANMSHQLRTPLNAIVGYATLLQEDALASGRSDEVDDLGRVLQASRNLLELINDMLELSKIETGKTSFQRGIVDIGSLVQSVVTSFDPEEQGNGNLLAAEVEDEIGIMIGDSGKIRQCLLNLVSNALKFTQAGEVRLTASAVERQGREMIEFSVTDTGVGMSPEELKTLFREVQVEGEEGQLKGPRLGLTITHRLATMMGGTVDVRSNPGRGSVFTLRLPREMSRAIPSEDVLPFINKRENIVATAGRKALIVDDDPLARDLMARWLSRLGFHILSADDGETGLAAAREHKPAVILLDILMPGLDGYGVLEALRADPEIASIPVVIVSVCDDRAAALRAGASEALIKPVQPQQLEQVLDVYCRRLTGDILVIEDDQDSGALIRRTAAQIGLTSRLARTGEEGLAMIREAAPAAVVLDLALPGMSGFQVLDELKNDDRFKRIPVLVVSGEEISVAQHQAIERSGGVFHTKGYSSPRDIAVSLKKVVAG